MSREGDAPIPVPAQFAGLGAARDPLAPDFRFSGAVLALLVLVSLPLFWPGLRAMGAAWLTPEYSHGPLIPLISLYLFLRTLRAEPKVYAPYSASSGLILLALALALAVLGGLVKIPDLVGYALILFMMALTALSLGRARALPFAPAVLHLIFMLPLPKFLYWKLSVTLQLLSSQIGVAVIRALDIPVFLEGNVIDLGVYKLQVAEACSGLRYLFPILSFSYLFGVLYRGPFAHKALLFLAAGPLTVLMNALRIGAIGVLVDRYGIAQAEGFLHVFEGWVIFGACIAALLGLAAALSRLASEPLSLRETLDLDFDGLGLEAARIARLPLRWGLVAALALTSAVTLAQSLIPARETVLPQRVSFEEFPIILNDLTAKPAAIDSQSLAVLGATDVLSVSLSNAPESLTAPPPVALFVAYYARQTEGQGIHSPEVCLPVGGWEITEIAPIPLDFGPQEVIRAVIRNGLAKQLVYYWFDQRGQTMTSEYRAKLAVLVDALLTGRSDGALIRFSTPVAPMESEAEAEARLQETLRASLPALTPFLPK